MDGLERAMVAEMTANREAIGEVATLLRERRDRHASRLDDHERRLRALERRER